MLNRLQNGENRIFINSSSWSRIINIFQKKIKQLLKINDITNECIKFPSQDALYNLLMKLRLVRIDRDYDIIIRDRKIFLLKTIIQSREILSQNLYIEDLQRKDEEAIKAKKTKKNK